MTGRATDDDFTWDGEWPEADGPPRQRGITQETVDQIRRVVLGADDGPEGQHLIAHESVDAARTSVSSGEVLPRRRSGRFEKGSSGNYGGRPKNVPAPIPPALPDPDSAGAITHRHVMRLVKAMTGEGEVTMPLLEGIIAKLAQAAANGDPSSTRILMLLVEKADVAVAAHRRELFRHWSEMKLLAIKIWTEAKQAGRPRPMFVHPDDIQLNADGTVTILGPSEANDIAAMRQIHGKVEYHLINIAYQRWLLHRWERMSGRPAPPGKLLAELEFEVEQSELPPRLRLTAEEILKRKAPFVALAGRALHGRLKQEAAKFNLPVPPREVRRPTIIDQDALDAAEQDGLSKRAFLKEWLDATRIARSTASKR